MLRTVALLCMLQGWQACVDGVKEMVDSKGNHAVAEHCAAVVSVGGGGVCVWVGGGSNSKKGRHVEG